MFLHEGDLAIEQTEYSGKRLLPFFLRVFIGKFPQSSGRVIDNNLVKENLFVHSN